MDENSTTTDDDRQTFIVEQSSTDETSSVTYENLSITVYKNNQQQISKINNPCIRPVKIINRTSLPNLKIKHPYQSNNNDLYDDEKRIINDEHVKVSRTNRASLHTLTTETLLSKLEESARRKSIDNIIVSRANGRISYILGDTRLNPDTMQITPRHSTVHTNQAPVNNNIRLDFDQKAVAAKPVITRVSFSNEFPLKMDQNGSHVTVKHVSVNQKRSSLM